MSENQNKEMPQQRATPEERLLNQISKIQLPKDRTGDGKIDMDKMGTIVSRLPHEELFKDMFTLFPDLTQDEILQAYKSAVHGINSSPPRTFLEINKPEAIAKNLIRFAAKGRPWMLGMSDPEHNLFVKTVKPLLDCVSAESDPKKAIENYKINNVPILKALNHAYAANALCQLSTQNLDTASALQGLKYNKVYSEQQVSNLSTLDSTIRHLVSLEGDEFKQYKDKIAELNSRLTILKEKDQFRIQRIVHLRPRIELSDSFLAFDSAELLDVTLDLLEDQLAFLERTIEDSTAKVEGDIKENERIDLEITFRLYKEKIEPLVQAINIGEQQITFLETKLDDIDRLYGELSQELGKCKSTYEACVGAISRVKWPGPLTFNKGQKFIADIETALNAYRDEFLQVRVLSENAQTQLQGIENSTFKPNTDTQGIDIQLPIENNEQEREKKFRETKQKSDQIGIQINALEERITRNKPELAKLVADIAKWSETFKALNALVSQADAKQISKERVNSQLDEIAQSLKSVGLIY